MDQFYYNVEILIDFSTNLWCYAH